MQPVCLQMQPSLLLPHYQWYRPWPRTLYAVPGYRMNIARHVEYAANTALSLYPGSLIIAGEEKRAWFQSLTYTAVIFHLMSCWLN